MAKFGLKAWADLSKYHWPDLLVGNGASVAVSTRYSYQSLYERATLSSEDRDVFTALGTKDFELVLSHLKVAALVCEQLGHPHREVQDRYRSIRKSLISAVRRHHVTWNEVDDGNRLGRIRTALRKYDRVFSTNYDLLLYWAMMHGGANGFKDFFWAPGCTFDPLDVEVGAGATLVYWLHGGLHLYRDTAGATAKRTNDGSDLLAQLGASGRVPLFVSEGTSRQKRQAIRRSDYLDFAFKEFAGSEENLVIFGHALGTADRHLVRAISRHGKERIAYGVHATSQRDVDLRVAEIKAMFPTMKVDAFDSATHPLGRATLRVP